MQHQRFEVSRQDLHHTRWVDDPDAARALAPGEARLKVAQYALTANNITYAAFGEAMKYWQFFPCAEPGWGCVPVWGFATVAESRAEGLAPGERVYGYLPMGTHLVVRPERVRDSGFVDASAHREGLAAVYNQYTLCRNDAAWSPAREGHIALLRPLFITSFLIDDFLAGEGFFGAQQVLLSSASSKTAYGTAHRLALRRGQPGTPRLIGLTSPAKLGFTGGLPCYDQVLAYDALGTLDATVPTVYVDFAGDAALRRAVHGHFGSALQHSAAIGGTHWDQLTSSADAREPLPGPRPTLFFAPSQVKRRTGPAPEGWGPAGFAERVAEAWARFLAAVDAPGAAWLIVEHGQGPEAIAAAYQRQMQGRVDAQAGLVLSP
jgi:hypothetical protein